MSVPRPQLPVGVDTLHALLRFDPAYGELNDSDNEYVAAAIGVFDAALASASSDYDNAMRLASVTNLDDQTASVRRQFRRLEQLRESQPTIAQTTNALGDVAVLHRQAVALAASARTHIAKRADGLRPNAPGLQVGMIQAMICLCFIIIVVACWQRPSVRHYQDVHYVDSNGRLHTAA